MDEPLAKPDQGLLEHLQEVAERGQKIAERLGLGEDLKKRVVLACWLHDVGKALRSFQSYIKAVQELERAKVKGAPEHEIDRLRKVAYSRKAWAFPHALAALAPTLVIEEKLLGEPFLATAAVISHHSPLTESLYAKRERPPEDPESLLRFLRVLLPILGIQEKLLRDVQELLQLPPSGILDDLRIGLRGKFRSLTREDFAAVKTVLHLADWTASAGKDPEALFLSQGGRSIQMYLKEKGFEPHKFQEKAASLTGSSLALQAPTGTGKTEALLLWAGDAERILYLLPTQATVNAMWERLKKVYGEDVVGLAHGRSGYVLRKTYGEEEGSLDHRLFGSAFAQPVVVATLDQYLIGHLQGRHWEERLTLSKQAAVILDEIHAYEPFTLGLLKEALESVPPKRLALASATLPSPLHSIFPTEEKIRAEEKFWNRRRYQLVLRDTTITEGLSEAVEAARSGKAVLLIVNTVLKAQSLYRFLRKRQGIPPERLKLLHSRFVFRDRAVKEKQAKPEPGTLLVATQVVEVSLDISYDLLFTEIAPLDALVQRMGRVNRDGTRPPVPVLIHTAWDKGSAAVYEQELLKRSLDLLERLSVSPTDGELVEVTDSLYREIMPRESYRKELELGRERLQELRDILGCYTLDLSDEKLRAFFTTRRRGGISIDVLPKSLLAEAERLVEAGKRWKLPELLVPVPAYWVSRYWDHWFWPCTDLGVYVTELEYNPEIGVQPPAEEEPDPFEFV